MLLFALCWSLFASVAFAAFGYTDQGTYWTIDTGASLVIQVSKTNGDITSMKYNVSTDIRPPCKARPEPTKGPRSDRRYICRVSSTTAMMERTPM